MGIFLDMTWVVPLVTTLDHYICLVGFRRGSLHLNRCYREGGQLDNPPKSSSKHINLQESPLHHLWIAEYQPLWIYQVGSSAAEPLVVVVHKPVAIYVCICNVYMVMKESDSSVFFWFFDSCGTKGKWDCYNPAPCMEYLPVHLQWAQAIHAGKFAPYMEHNLRVIFTDEIWRNFCLANRRRHDSRNNNFQGVRELNLLVIGCQIRHFFCSVFDVQTPKFRQLDETGFYIISIYIYI